MTERIKGLLERTFDKEQARFRRDVDWKPLLEKFIAEKIEGIFLPVLGRIYRPDSL